MNLASFLASWRGTLILGRLQLGAIGVLATAVLFQATLLLQRDAVVVLVPPGLQDEVEIASARADQSYVEAWGLHLASLLGNVTPDNGNFIKEAIAPLLAPEIYEPVTQIIERQLAQIRRDRVTLRFEPKRILWEASTSKVFVHGFGVTQAVGGSAERVMRTYEIELEIHRHQPLISHLTTYAGEPRTQDELRRRAARAETEEIEP